MSSASASAPLLTPPPSDNPSPPTTPSSSAPTPSAPPPAAHPPPASPPPLPPQSPPPAPPQSPPPSPPPPDASPPPQSPPPRSLSSPPPAPPAQPTPSVPDPSPNPVPNPSPVPTPSNPSLSPPVPLNPPGDDNSGDFTPPAPSHSGSGSGKSKSPSGGEKHGSKSHSPPDDGKPVDSEGQSPPKSDDSGSNQALFTGIGLGIGMFIIIMLISALVFVIKKKKKPHYYTDGKGAKGPAFQGKGMDHNIKIPPPPGLGGKPGWQQQSPGPMSSDTNSGAYTGSGSTSSLPPLSPNYGLGFNKSTFTYEELAAATAGFSPSNMIGQGGFGYVYKGILPNGKEVAVKQLKAGSGQGEREFQAEVEIISRVHHRHLVSLVGYCIAGVQRMLIYEYVPNKTMEYHLHG